MSIAWEYVDGQRRLPEGFFGPPEERGEDWPDDPELRAAVEWFIELLGHDEWERKRTEVAEFFYSSPEEKVTFDSRGRYFDSSDTFAWYLFHAEAFLDYVWHYEPMTGSKAVPVFKALGQRMDLLKAIPNVEERARRIFGSERSQPNGGLFELLVASKYAELGATVSFKPEQPGIAKTHDLDVELSGRKFAVECKRMDAGDYAESERARARVLWGPVANQFVRLRRSVFCNANFLVPLEDVPDDYLLSKAHEFLSGDASNLIWNDEIGWGGIGNVDLAPLNQHLEDYDVLIDGTLFHEFIAGVYIRNASIIQTTRHMTDASPRHMSECDLAIMLRWASVSHDSIERKARDITRHLARANEQLPDDCDAIVHIGFDAVDRAEVEVRRRQRIFETVNNFDPGDKRLCRVYCHWFAPESPPHEAWAYDETVNWFDFVPDMPQNFAGAMTVVMPESADFREGVHWEPSDQTP